jgi:hypothetical protein
MVILLARVAPDVEERVVLIEDELVADVHECFLA